jgi:hypothetical protein
MLRRVLGWHSQFARAYWLESGSGTFNIHTTSPDKVRLRLMDICQTRGSTEAFPARMNEKASCCGCFSSFFFSQLSADEIDQLIAKGHIFRLRPPEEARERNKVRHGPAR